MQPTKLVFDERLIPLPDMREWFPGLGFSGRTELETRGEAVYVTDPIYLADVYNPSDDPLARFLCTEAVTVYGFAGGGCPVWWADPYLVIPTSFHYESELRPPPGTKVLASHVACDSVSYSFFTVPADAESVLGRAVRALIKDHNAAALDLPAGRYRFFLEQFDPKRGEEHWPHFNRNIVARRTETL